MDSIGIKDIHYLLQWDKNDLNSIYSLCKNIREGDQKAVKEWDSIIGNNGFVTPLKICKDDKYLMTWKGIAKFCRLITKQDNDTFTTVAVGTGTTIPQPYDANLVTEIASVEFATNGFFDGSGTTIRYCGTFPSTTESADLKESLVRNQHGSTGAIVMCRNIFPDNFIDHNSGSAGFSAAGIIEFVPIV